MSYEVAGITSSQNLQGSFGDLIPWMWIGDMDSLPEIRFRVRYT